LTSAVSHTPCILITGTTRGLGLALAQEYLRAGERVAGCARGGAAIEHSNYHHFSLDVGDESSIAKMFAGLSTLKLVPRLLVNNAGLNHMRLAALTSEVAARRILDTNLLGAFLICRETLKTMQRHRFGRIVNLCSVSVPLATVGNTLYNASKAALDAMGHTLANECRAYDITVNSLGLSLVAQTGMADAISERAVAELRTHLLKPASLETAEIVAAINFFSSPEARNITGQMLYFGGVR
jgi:3-oxoacyl-[acyl-carrier protein] reductase